MYKIKNNYLAALRSFAILANLRLSEKFILLMGIRPDPASPTSTDETDKAAMPSGSDVRRSLSSLSGCKLFEAANCRLA